MPFEDVVISGYGAAVQNLPLAEGEEPRSTINLINEASIKAIAAAGIDRHDVDAILTHRPAAGDSFLLFGQKILAELKIAPSSSTAVMNHGAGMLSAFKYGALLLEAGLADHVLCASGDAGNLWLTDDVGTNANIESDAHFEAPYRPITPALYGQFAQRFVYEHGVTDEDLARVCVDLRYNALQHPEAQMRDKGELTIEQVMESPMIASPSRLFHCAPWYKGGRAGAVILSRRENSPDPAGKHVHLRGVGECITHEHVSGRFGLRYGPWADGPNLTVSATYLAAKQAYEFGGFGIEDADVVLTPAPFAFLVMMVIEDLGLCGRGEAADYVRSGALRVGNGRPAFATNGTMLSFGQCGLNGVMDQILEAVHQMEGTAPGYQVDSATRAVIQAHGGALASHTVGLFERV